MSFRAAKYMKDIPIEVNVELPIKNIVHITFLIPLDVKCLKEIHRQSRSICIRGFIVIPHICLVGSNFSLKIVSLSYIVVHIYIYI